VRPPPRPRQPASPDRRAAPDRGASASSTGEPTGDHPSRPAASREAGGRPRRPASLDRPVGAADAAGLLGSHEDGVSQGLPDRLEERRRARRRLRATRIAIALAVVALVAGAVWTLLASPVFRVTPQDVQVQGATQALTAEQVRDAVSPYTGTSLMLVDTDAVAAAVAALPLARDVSVARDWPRALTVSLQVRTPAMGVAVDGGVDLVDDQGVVVGREPELPAGLPMAALPTDGDDAAGARAMAAGMVATVWAALPDDLRAQVDTLSADGVGVTMSLTGGRTVRWGTGDDSDFKARVLGVLLSQRPSTTYDVSTPTRPVTS